MVVFSMHNRTKGIRAPNIYQSPRYGGQKLVHVVFEWPLAMQSDRKVAWFYVQTFRFVVLSFSGISVRFLKIIWFTLNSNIGEKSFKNQIKIKWNNSIWRNCIFWQMNPVWLDWKIDHLNFCFPINASARHSVIRLF